MAELQTPYLCQACGQWHPVLPLSFSVRAPLAATNIPAADLERRLVITRDQCVLDNARFFLRGRIVIPILDAPTPNPFVWGVWAEISPKHFLHTQNRWSTPGREADPPFRGYLDTDLPLFGSTLNLEIDILTQPVGRRPHFRVVSATHPLGLEQRHGITLARVQEIASWVTCRQHTPA